MLPNSALDAAEAWERGEEIEAFEVETAGAGQGQIYACAFDLLKNVKNHKGHSFLSIGDGVIFPLSARELDVAKAIALVALKDGWANMVARHLAGGHVKKIHIRKPAA